MLKILSLLLFLSFFWLGSCSKAQKMKKSKVKKDNMKVDYIVRRHDTHFCPIYEPKRQEREPYPWENANFKNIAKITKEFFRCKGSVHNTQIFDDSDVDKPISIKDCSGGESHLLPSIHGRENVYPTLINILNFIQEKAKKRVVITSGHRCPRHNRYVDISKKNKLSKHMIGAEVDFYVQSFEDSPEKIIDYILQYYKSSSYRKNGDYYSFSKAKEKDLTVKTWWNKEVIIRQFNSREGRDFDNRHPFPYISIEIIYDMQLDEKVSMPKDMHNIHG